MAKGTPDLSWAEERPLRKAVVIYDSPHGETQRLAEALADGIRAGGIPTDVMTAGAAKDASLDAYDLIAIGSPNAWLSASPAVHELLEKFPSAGLKGRYGFAFDTRTKGHPDGAAPEIVRKMRRVGLNVVVPPVSVPMVRHPAGAAPSGAAAAGPSFDLPAAGPDEFRELGTSLVRSIHHETAQIWS